MQKFTRVFDSIITLWILSCVVILLAYCLWSLDRGLDLTDESYYLATAMHPEAIMLWATAMHWFTSGLWQLSGSLVGFRAIGMAILVLSSIVLGLGLEHSFRAFGVGVACRKRQVLLIVACSLAGASLYHAFVPFTPSYNLLAVSGTYLGLGLVSLTANALRSLRFYGFHMLAGVALGVAFLAKFSSGTIAWGIICVIAAVLGDSFRERMLRIVLITISMMATIVTIILVQSSFGEALAQFRLGSVVYMLGTNETFSERLIRYLNQTGDFFRLIAIDFWIPLVLFGIHTVRPRFWIALIGLAIFGYIVLTNGYLLGGMDRYEQQTAPLLVAVVLILLATARIWIRNRKAICVLGALALLPVCTAIGTFNALHTQILFSLAPWGVLVGLLAFALPLPAENRFVAGLIGALFITTVTSQVLTNGFRAPYRLFRPLQEQSEAITIPPLGTFKVDSASREAYIKLIQVADSCGIQPGQTFLGLYNIPGIGLMLQTVMPGFPLLQDRLSTEPILDSLLPETLQSAAIGIDLDTGSFDPSMPKQLARFPAGYRLCGTFTLPYRQQKVELWVNSDQQ